MANINNEFMAKVFAELHHGLFMEFVRKNERSEQDDLIMQNQQGENVRILCLNANLQLGDFVHYRARDDDHPVAKPSLDLSDEARIREIALHFPFMSSELRRHNKILVSLDIDQLEILYQRMHDMAVFIGDFDDYGSKYYQELNAYKELISQRIAHDIASERVGSDQLCGVRSQLYTGVVAEFVIDNQEALIEFYGLNVAAKVSKWADDYAENIRYFKDLISSVETTIESDQSLSH